MWSWGNNNFGQLGLGSGVTGIRPEPAKIEALRSKRIVKVHAGEYHSLALGADGTVYTWGRNDRGQLGLDSVTDRYHADRKSNV